MSQWTTLGELPPGTPFETESGERGLRSAPLCQWVRFGDGVHMYDNLRTRRVRPLPMPGESPSPLTEEDRGRIVEECISLVRQLAIPAGVITHPNHVVVGSDGVERTAADIAQQIVKEMQPGATLFLPHDSGWSYEPPAALRHMSRLLWLLGLSPMERAFVSALAETPTEKATLFAFIDWLFDQQRDEEAKALATGWRERLLAAIARWKEATHHEATGAWAAIRRELGMGDET